MRMVMERPVERRGVWGTMRGLLNGLGGAVMGAALVYAVLSWYGVSVPKPVPTAENVTPKVVDGVDAPAVRMAVRRDGDSGTDLHAHFVSVSKDISVPGKIEEVWMPVTKDEPVATESPRQAEQIFARMKQIIHQQNQEIAAAQAELAALRQGGGRHEVAAR